MTCLRIAVVAALLAAPFAVRAGTQAPFKSGASTVAVYTTVTDLKGRLVPDLDRDRFEVYDEGKLQPITAFANEIQPITVVMMLDRSLSMLGNFALVEEAASAFVDRLLPEDKAKIGSFSDRVQVDPREFTSDKDVMREILKSQLQPPGPTPLWNALGVAMTALLHQQGRRVVLVFTDGMDQPLNGAAHNVTFKDVVRRSEQEDVMIYAIGLAGHVPFAGFGRPDGSGGRGRGGGGGIGGIGGWGGIKNREDKPDPGLQVLAQASGGGYFELTATDDLSPTFERVADELHRQYLLGFVPQKLDGKAHKLEVRVKGEGLSARARRTYVAAAADGSR
jgi:VWFA-related protein